MGSRPHARPATLRAIDTFRQTILAQKEGAFLGSEEELRAQLCISRATLREVARILEYEMLLQVRRGVGGGYYGARPTADFVAKAAATYLKIHDTSSWDILVAMHMLTRLGSDLAARSNLSEARERLIEVRREIGARDVDAQSNHAFVEEEYRLIEAAVGLIESMPIRLMITIFHTFTRTPPMSREMRIPRRARRPWRQAQLRRIDAIIEGDGDLADLCARRQFEMFLKWQDASPRPGSLPVAAGTGAV